MPNAALTPVRSTRVEFNLEDGIPDELAHVEHPTEHRHRDIEPVRLENEALARRVMRLTTEAGREVSLRLPSGSAALRPGDVIAVTDTSFITIEAETTRVIVVRPESIRQMGESAHALGNRHRQVQFFDADSRFGQVVFITPNDHTVADHLTALGTPFTIEDVELDAPFRHAEHTH